MGRIKGKARRSGRLKGVRGLLLKTGGIPGVWSICRRR
jgi:hypothetical protein